MILPRDALPFFRYLQKVQWQRDLAESRQRRHRRDSAGGNFALEVDLDSGRHPGYEDGPSCPARKDCR